MAIQCEVRIDAECLKVATHTVDDGYSIIECCLPCADHADSHSTVTPSMLTATPPSPPGCTSGTYTTPTWNKVHMINTPSPHPITYAPLAHMVEGMGHVKQPDEDTIIEHLWCDLAHMKGDDAAEAYMMRQIDLDFDFDYHDYHAEWNRGFEADIREW